MPRVLKFANGVHTIRKGSVVYLTGEYPYAVRITGFKKDMVYAEDAEDSDGIIVGMKLQSLSDCIFIS